MKRYTIGVIVSSPVISAGIAHMLRGINDCVQAVVEVSAPEAREWMERRNPAVIVTDGHALPQFSLISAETDRPVRRILLVSSLLPQSVTSLYDDVISVYDTRAAIGEVLMRNLPGDEPEDRVCELSPRERDVVVGVVKGLSNKEIAESLHVSVNTVMTHRRNIASKLQIHSPAGLTIYAIVSNLVNLEDIRGKI